MANDIRVTFNKETKLVAKMSTTGGFLQSTTPLTVKNQFREYQINSIEDLPDVAETNVTDGAMLVYNANTDLYEVRPVEITDFDTDNLSLDGGEF